MPTITRNGTRTRTVRVGGPTVAAIKQGAGGVVVDRTRLVHTIGRTRVVRVPSGGLTGAPGRDGADASSLFDATSGEAINALRVVRGSGDEIFRCNGDDASHAGTAIGITVTATSAPGESQTVRSDGLMVDAAWNFASGPVYCGPAGVLTQNPDLASAFVCQVAVAKSPTEILVDIQPPIRRG